MLLGKIARVCLWLLACTRQPKYPGMVSKTPRDKVDSVHSIRWVDRPIAWLIRWQGMPLLIWTVMNYLPVWNFERGDHVQWFAKEHRNIWLPGGTPRSDSSMKIPYLNREMSMARSIVWVFFNIFPPISFSNWGNHFPCSVFAVVVFDAAIIAVCGVTFTDAHMMIDGSFVTYCVEGRLQCYTMLSAVSFYCNFSKVFFFNKKKNLTIVLYKTITFL